MILVVGATGILGAEICERLGRRQIAVRALARPTANPARLTALRDAGAEVVWGDLKDPESLAQACRGVDVVISTASSTLSRQSGDSIETVDRLGQMALIDAARKAGVQHFTFVSIPRNPVHSSPLSLAKAQAETALIESGIPYTILAANFFMEVWLSPALGFDYPHRNAVIFGNGQAPMSWISYFDVAEFAVRSHLVPGARHRILEIGGPQDLSPLDVIRIFERATESSFHLQFVPEEALVAQMSQAADPLSESFAKLQIEYAHGCVMDSSPALALMPMEMGTVEKYAAAVCVQPVPST